jgi:hypothetical protein
VGKVEVYGPVGIGLYKMDGPKTRTELKKSGKRDGGPYSAKHIRLAEEARRKTTHTHKKVKLNSLILAMV